MTVFDLDKYGPGPFAVKRFAWGNNERRAQLKDRICLVLAHGALNSVLVLFPDTGEKVVTSERALR